MTAPSGRYDELPDDYKNWREAKKSAFLAFALLDLRRQEKVVIEESRKLNYKGTFDKSKIDERPDELK